MKFLTKLSLLYIFFFFISCSNQKEVKVVESTYPNGQEKLVRFYIEKGNQKQLIREIQYYENGITNFEGSFQNNKKEGVWKYWYKNGNLWSEGRFKSGQPDGLRQVYFENGKLYYSGMFVKGKPAGKWKFYNEAGALIKEVNY